jgi:hypothetical protein
MLPSGHYVFMVKSAAIQTTGSGSFNNLSQGIFIEADLNGAPPPLPSVSIAATDPTGNENGDPIVFTLTRTTPIDSALNVSVQYSGTATPGQDYQAPTTISFPAGSPTATLTITPTKDSITEGAETIVVTLLAGAGYTLGSAVSATATIQADPPPTPPTVNIAATDAIGDENGDPIVFTLTRTTPIDAALNVLVQFSGTATPGQDYVANTNITFAAGSATAKLTIKAIQDSINEKDETVTVTLLTNAAYAVGITNSATATIIGGGQSKILSSSISQIGAFGFNATGFANAAYRVECRTPTGSWTVRTNGVAAADGSIVYRENNPAASPCLYYRVVTQ